MFGLIKRYKHDAEIQQKNTRIHELEEILCPCGQHDYIKIGIENVCNMTDNIGDICDPGMSYKVSQCKRCKKIMKEWIY